MEASENKIAHAVDHWFNRVIGGFVIEFSIDTSVSYSETERRFSKGPRGEYVKYLNTYIKNVIVRKMGYAATLMFGATRNRKTYRNKGKRGLEYSLLISPP